MKAFLLILLSTISVASAQKLSCEDFHTGKFKIIHNGNIYRVERGEKYQHDYNHDDAAYMRREIRWKDDCTYVCDNAKFKGPDKKNYKNQPAHRIRVKMYDFKEDRCTIFVEYLEPNLGNFEMTLIKLDDDAPGDWHM